MWPSCSSEMPAESYPRYSRRSSPATRRSLQGRLPTYPTMPHMKAVQGTAGGADALLRELLRHHVRKAPCDLVGLVLRRGLDHDPDEGLRARGTEEHPSASLECRGFALDRASDRIGSRDGLAVDHADVDERLREPVHRNGLTEVAVAERAHDQKRGGDAIAGPSGLGPNDM